ncbi:MAG: glycosyltransferase family 4 protein [Bacteroidales bacterium]|nr:glycosyltransferase family 4 protein [Bacteroidales bacterium]
MKIFFITRGWPSEQRPQNGNFERDQAVALSALGHQVFCLILDIRIEANTRKLGVAKEVRNGVTVYSYYPGSRCLKLLRKVSRKLQYNTFEALFLHLFKRVVKAEGLPDVVYGHYLRYCRRALAIKRKFGIPAVGIEHWSEMGKENIKEELKKQAAETYPYMDRQLVVSEALRENILKNIGVDTTVVYDNYGKEFYYKEHVKKDDIVRFVLVGNLRPIKRFDVVIRALGENTSLPKNIRFTIIGDGPEKKNLLGMIEKYHLSEVVNLVGRKTREYIVNALQEADVYILSSHLETFGVAPVEALACGVPVIATDCGGSRSYMNDFNGLLIPADDVKALSEAIKYMAEHYSGYDRKRIAEECRQKFSSEAIAKQLEIVFEDVIVKSKK